MKKWFFIFLFFVFVFFGLLTRNYRLKNLSYLEWDEGMYAQIAKEIIKNKTLITTFNGNLWLDKPPLSHLLIAFSFLTLGENEFNSRMVMVILAFLAIILLYLLNKKISKKIFGKEKIFALTLPMIILAATPIFLDKATNLNSDLLVVISWLGYLNFFENNFARVVFLTIGVWGKSVLGFYPLLYDAFLLISKKQKLNFFYIKWTLTAIFVSSLWYIFLFLKFGYFFIENHFLSQMFKRIYVPIELHFGGKFFYFISLWKNLGLFLILITITYLVIAFDLFLRFKKNLKKLKFYFIYFFPLPFLGFLTLMKTKIEWYTVIFLPFLIMPITYLFYKIKSRPIYLIINFLIFSFFLSIFIKQTFLLTVPNEEKNEKVVLAKCLSLKKENKIFFLVDEQERKNRNFLEAAHYQTTSSFFYGGTPSFVYYVKKPVTFFYNPEEFKKNLNKNNTIYVINKNDKKLTNLEIKKTICQTKNWLSF